MFPLNTGKLDAVTALEKVAKKHNATVHQVALSWLLHHANNIILIPGTFKVSHLEENMNTLKLQLSEDDLKDLNHLK